MLSLAAYLVVNFLEEVLEAAIILLENCVFSGEV